MNIDVDFVDASGNSIPHPFISKWLDDNMVEIIMAITRFSECKRLWGHKGQHNYTSKWPWNDGDYCFVLQVSKLYTEYITQYNVGSRLQPIYYDFVKWANEFIENGGSIYLIEDN